MPLSEERLKILKMVQEGKITADEAAQLLEAMDITITPTLPEKPQRTGGKASLLRVLVSDTDTGRKRVDVRLPVGLVRAGIKAGAHFAPEIEGLDLDELLGFIENNSLGKIVDVFDEDDGEHVEVFLE